MLTDWISRRLSWLSRQGASSASTLPDAASSSLRKPFIKRGLLHTSLQFTTTEAQSRMWTFRPQALQIGYTRTMMGFVRFTPAPERIAMIGLGGGSLAKYCYRHLPGCAVDVVEINPHVIALRTTFRVPANDRRFQVYQDDGARFIRQHRRRYDALLVDGYDESGIPAPLASQQFYNDCYSALVDGGVLVVNLFCSDADRHLQRMRKAFGSNVISVIEPGMSNQVVFAWVGRMRNDTESLLSAKAQADLEAEFARVDAARLAH